jgi:2-polyprenyl-3-methyl-5-hydroxy-6-metoxy-1,4-benzoquinol methylase
MAEDVFLMSSDTHKSLAEIRAYWEQAATQDVDAQGLRPTARDPHLQAVVESIMERRLGPGMKLLDLGCGDGRSTILFSRSVKSAVGMDYVESFVERARAHAQQHGALNTTFLAGDVRDLGPVRRQFGRFDVATSIRCLINLASWSNQAQALEQIAGTIEPGGLLLMSEGWTEGMAGLNARRQRAGLTGIAVVPYNTLLSRAQFEAEASRHFEVVAYHNLGFYLYMSRVFQPRFVAPDAPRHDHPINAIAADLQLGCADDSEFEDCDYAGIYVLRRKA